MREGARSPIQFGESYTSRTCATHSEIVNVAQSFPGALQHCLKARYTAAVNQLLRAQTHYIQRHAILIALIGLLAIGLLYPIALTVRAGFAEDVGTNTGWTLRHLLRVLRDPSAIDGLINAFIIAIGTTTLSALIGLPLAIVSARRVFPFQRFWNAAVLAPLILPPFVGAIGLKSLLGRAGAFNTLLGTDFDVLGSARLLGVIVALALHLYPIIYLNAVASLANTDPALEQAADIHGAGRWRRFFTITLPLLRPGLFAGGTIVFVWSFTELGTPLIFDFSQVTAVQIYTGVKEMNVAARPYALTIVLLTCALLVYAVGKLALGRPLDATTTRAASHVETKRLRGSRAWAASGLFALVTTLALIPHIGVVLQSLTAPGGWYGTVLPSDWTLENFDTALSHPLAFGAIRNSIMLSIAALAITSILGFLIAYTTTRTKLRGRFALDTLAMTPLAVPGLVMAFGYVAVSLRWPFGPGDPFEGVIDVVGSSPNPFPLLALAYAVRRLPYMVRSISAGLEQVPTDVEEAGRIFGFNRLNVILRIVTPLVIANMLAGGLLVFSFSMLEVSDSLVLAQRESDFPITKAMLGFSERLGDGVGVACAMGVWGMALLALTLAVASLSLGKRMGAVFRA